MEIDFTGKRILVTGGTRGIGRGIVEAFLAAGARVALNGSSAESVDKAIKEINGEQRLIAAPGSLSTVEGCRQAVAAALAALGGLDVLVNNAGAGDIGSVEATDEATWDRVIDTNLKGMFFVTKYALPALRASSGNIVNVASVFGLVGVADASVYCTSKAGVINMTRSHALEFAPEVRVNAICPGSVDTDMLRDAATKVRRQRRGRLRSLQQRLRAEARRACAGDCRSGPVPGLRPRQLRHRLHPRRRWRRDNRLRTSL